MEFNELMQSFAAKYGLTDLNADDGTAVLEIDGMTVGFIHEPATESVMVVAEIGYPETDVSANFASAMLKANYLFAGTAGAVLCQNPETGAYAVMREYRLVEYDPKTFEDALETLLNSADQWKGVLGAVNEGDAEDAEDDEEDEVDETDTVAVDELPTVPASGFIRV